MIHIDLLPNFEQDDCDIIKQTALGGFDLSQLSKAEEDVRAMIQEMIPGDIFFFSSAREALFSFLQFYLSKTPQKEVLTQALSCLVVPNAILGAGGVPVFVDVKHCDINMAASDAEKKITNQTAALIIQNTLGIPADYENLLACARKKNLFVIENLTHALGAKYKGVFLGNFGDASLLSFGRAKVVSSLGGGALIIRNKNISSQFSVFYESLHPMKSFEARHAALFFWFAYLARKNFSSWGKAALALARKINFTYLEINPSERQGKLPRGFGRVMPRLFFPLLLHQLKKLNDFNSHRKKVAELYQDHNLHLSARLSDQSEAVFLRYPLFSRDRDKILTFFKKKNIYIGNWYASVLAPEKDNLKRFGYVEGSCPEAEYMASGLYNLPTSILMTEQEALALVPYIREFNL